MIESIPNIREDEGFKNGAKYYAECIMKNKTFRADDFENQIKYLLIDAYQRGGQEGFRTAWLIQENRR
jgi:hypothetical protein